MVELEQKTASIKDWLKLISKIGWRATLALILSRDSKPPAPPSPEPTTTQLVEHLYDSAAPEENQSSAEQPSWSDTIDYPLLKGNGAEGPAQYEYVVEIPEIGTCVLQIREKEGELRLYLFVLNPPPAGGSFSLVFLDENRKKIKIFGN